MNIAPVLIRLNSMTFLYIRKLQIFYRQLSSVRSETGNDVNATGILKWLSTLHFLPKTDVTRGMFGLSLRL